MDSTNRHRSARRPELLGWLAALTTASLCASMTSAGEIERGARRGEARCLVEWSERPAQGPQRILLRIFEDGHVEAESPLGSGPLHTDRISPDAARELAADLAKRLAEGAVTTDSLKSERVEQARRTGLSAEIVGASESTLRISHPECPASIACPAVDLLAERYPCAYRHQTLRDQYETLRNIQAIAQAGGRESARELAAAASRRLKAEYPTATDWTVDELAMVRALPSGTRMVQFRRLCVRARTTGHVREWWITNLVESPGAPLQVTVIAPDRVTR